MECFHAFVVVVVVVKEVSKTGLSSRFHLVEPEQVGQKRFAHIQEDRAAQQEVEQMKDPDEL